MQQGEAVRRAGAGPAYLPASATARAAGSAGAAAAPPPVSSRNAKNLSELRLNMLLGGGCTAATVAVFHPLDSVRIRWQVLHASRSGVAPADAEGMLAFALGVARREGLVSGLWRPGVFAHSAATMVSSSFRLGVYPTLRDALVGEQGTKNALHMWAAGFCAGTVGFFFASPLFMAKVRLQVSAGDRSLALVNRSATGVLAAVARAEGLRGLWRGSGTLVARGALLSAGSQLGYDWTKTKCKCNACSRSAGPSRPTAVCSCGGWLADGPVLHLLASVASAFLASVMAAPLDLVLTRYQAAPLLGVQYSGVLHCVGSIARNEGLPGFYRGFWPLFLRLAPLWSVSLPFYEATRRFVGLSYMT